MREGANAPLADEYHEYLVSLWSVAMMGHDDSGAAIPSGRCVFAPARTPSGVLRPISEILLSFESRRQASWQKMRDVVLNGLPEEGASIIAGAETSPLFESFFETFARAGR